MPRDYDDEDDHDDRPRKRRRRDDDDRDRPPPKSNTGLILLIVGLVVGLPVLGCAGFGIWAFFQAKKGIDQVMTMAGGEAAALSFLRTMEGGNVANAYDMTSANFKATKSKANFEAMVKANPVLTSAHVTDQTGFPSPTGTAPNRKMMLTFSIVPGHDFDAMDEDEGDPIKPKVPKPKGAKENPNAKPLVCTITVAEQADGQWKVDGFTIP